MNPDDLLEQLARIRLIHSIQAVLQWDQETVMPPAGGELRARQLAWLARRAHDQLTGEDFRRHLEEWVNPDTGAPRRSGADADTRRLLFLTWRQWKRATALPGELVTRLSEHESRTQQAWARLRPRNDFGAFAPLLKTMVQLKRQEAEALSLGPTLYDSLLDAYEPGMTSAELTEIFGVLTERLVPLVDRIRRSPRYAEPDPVTRTTYPRQAQQNLCREALTAMGLKPEASRLDRSAHPFTMGIHPGDVRLTTRYDDEDFRPALFAAIHEGGHALYEQGLEPEPFGSPLAEAASMGLHESQSRLWENLVARSRAFWEWFLSRLQRAFPAPAAGLSLESVLRGVNRVQPGLIRVEADEITYTLHIVLRFELERDLINGRMAVEDLPQAWNDRSRAWLGLTPPDFRDGVMQDVHWSFGAFGYFPSYALGNIYSAAIMKRIRRDLPDLDERLAAGRLEELTDWLRRYVYRAGCRRFGADLVAHLTDAPLSASPYLDYLEQKYSRIYDL